MKDSKRGLNTNWAVNWVNILAVGLGMICSLLLLVAAGIIIRFPELVDFIQVPYFAAGTAGIGLFIFTFSFVWLRKILRTQQKYKRLRLENCEIIELEVLDRFTYIKLLPGEEGNIAYRYFVKTATGNWQLANGLHAIFVRLQPGTRIRAAVKKRETIREILDLEILSEPAKKTNSGWLNQVTDKVASEVKVIGYRDGQYLTNRLHPLPELKYYLVVNNTPQLASGAAFSRIRLNQKYYEGLERATTLQITVKDKYVFLGLPSGEDGPLTYNYFVVSTASSWRLSTHLKELFSGITPGAALQIAVVDNCIMDIDFLENSYPVPAKVAGMVIGKVISDVKITGYQNGRYSIKRTKPAYPYRYYLTINNIPVEVSEAVFKSTPYYALFAPAKKQFAR
ncbi:hypothetical protein AAE02nite_33500 [Adhaeribacter aerolatus]|uniref:Uncharacterized protein n=1 Tax=Adhaeribacter aerolatus TaxID=670289 RepID=A0A512B152_9BACT|nr:hypothetical protein [Adhaeribacter aerolatus]GEO05686.1 hypothetical protein AAE02nite_33500 [Adhaeribacter aerolatus]